MTGIATHAQLKAVSKRTRKYLHGWVENQCLHCRYYHELEGEAGADWGVCFNEKSHRRGTLMFEHDGCVAHEYGEVE